MINLDDTIAAISTALGEGAIGIVRLSGPEAMAIAKRVFRSPKDKKIEDTPSHTLLYGFVIDPRTDEPIDEVLLTVLRAPNTYTREDMVEINCHGGMLSVKRVLETLLKEGARLARPGEFTLRAFVNGRIDLTQAEATLDIIRARTERSSKIALNQLRGGLSARLAPLRDVLTEVLMHVEAYIDFPEEELELETEKDFIEKLSLIGKELDLLSKSYEEGRLYREGVAVSIVGKPNVGKSSLLNALMKEDRAIVTELPGTTRDIIEECLNIQGLPVRIMDTAGIRETHDLAEAEGVRRSLQAIEGADLVIAMFDISRPLTDEDRMVIEKIKDRNSIIVLNKADLEHRVGSEEFPEGLPIVRISAKNEEGIEELKNAMFGRLIKSDVEETALITNIRHRLSIDRALQAVNRAIERIKERAPYEIIAFELRDALDGLGEIVGTVTTDDLLNRIFGEFCIGK
ncbi:MAG: tRNA uridine-5-carboxymethylaminomethyl(34) synthesis GTPase MnmE [Nitrospirae bacterium]|nr:MAG: tRNA uridine-5-carboxymethylaminomethyl(34) synthesis GTPase MnmE [Nitrospirota bacterium]